MAHSPSETALVWAAHALGPDATVRSVRSLTLERGPWLLRVEQAGRTQDVVLRLAGWIGPQGIATGAAALRHAEQHGLPAPRLLAADLDGSSAGAPATLETALPGSSTLPERVSVEQLSAVGAALARVHKIPLEPTQDLPLRHRPTSADDHARDRRKDNELPSTSLLLRADDRVREHGRPTNQVGFVHGDVWWGNTRWDGDTFLALIDWKDAGAGNPGVDFGGFRFQMALTYGHGQDHVLEGWEREAGRPATDVAYWDAVAALNTPTVLDGWPGFDDGLRPLDAAEVTARRDAFLRAAIDRL